MCLKSSCSKALGLIDLTHYTNGCHLLRIISYVHIGFIISVFLLISIEIDYLRHQYPEKIPRFLIIGILTNIANIIATILVWAARTTKTHCKKVLKCYCIFEMFMVPILFPMGTYIKIEFWNLKPSYNIIDQIVYVIFVSSKLYVIGHVYRIYFKLGSPIIDKLKSMHSREVDDHNEGFEGDNKSQDHLTKNHEAQWIWAKSRHHDQKTEWGSKLSLASQPSILVTPLLYDQTQIHSPFEIPKITNEDFKSKMINPLHITIDDSKLLGEGQFGKVFKAKLRLKGQSKQEVAAKVLKHIDSGDNFEMLLKEIKTTIAVGDHKNIVKFYGVTSDATLNAQLAVITELCDGGSLEKFLQEHRHTFVNLLQERGSLVLRDQQLYINLEVHGTHNSIDLIRFSLEIAEGMNYLVSKKIVHGDLAARNILLSKNLTVKLTDFGMSRRLYIYQVYISTKAYNQCLPWRWMSFEALRDLQYSEKSDVYAFGVVLWEIFSLGCFPFESLNWSLDILHQIKNGLRLQRPAFASKEIYNVMQHCWELETHARPTFQQLIALLQSPKMSNCYQLKINT